jgi:histidine triad (HIT) family protein
MTNMSECVFCKIIQKQAPSSIIYEDEHVLAFLSNRPVNIGHTLVVPKKHYTNIYEMPEDEVNYVFKIVKRLTHAVKDATDNPGIRIVQNNGKDAGQIVFHMHVHIIPMKPGNHFFHENGFRTPEMLDKDAQGIKHKIKCDAALLV